MLRTPRWEAEIRLMQSKVATFRPFAVPGSEAGFHGYLVGPRTHVMYHVVIRTRISDYPEQEPGVYIDPHPERHHWILDNRLCYQRQGHVWNAAEDNFFQALMLAAKYIAEFDGRRG
jgi:hypothetical protein